MPVMRIQTLKPLFIYASRSYTDGQRIVNHMAALPNKWDSISSSLDTVITKQYTYTHGNGQCTLRIAHNAYAEKWVSDLHVMCLHVSPVKMFPNTLPHPAPPMVFLLSIQNELLYNNLGDWTHWYMYKILLHQELWSTFQHYLLWHTDVHCTHITTIHAHTW